MSQIGTSRDNIRPRLLRYVLTECSAAIFLFTLTLASLTSCVRAGFDPRGDTDQRIVDTGSERSADGASDRSHDIPQDASADMPKDSSAADTPIDTPAPDTAVDQGPIDSGPRFVHTWSKRLGGAASESPNAVAVDTAGNIVIAGSFSGSTDLGGGSLLSAGGSDIFLAKYDTAGNHAWSQRFGSSASDFATAVATSSSGAIAFGGSFFRNIAFGGGVLGSAGNTDAFIAYFDQQGTHRWSKRFGADLSDRVQDIAIDSSGNVVVTGRFSGTVDFGGGPLTSAGGHDIFVVCLSSSGSHLWSRRFGGASTDTVHSIAVDPTDTITILGDFSGAFDPGTGTLTSAGSTDVLLLHLNSNGALIWAQRFGGTKFDNGFDLVTRADGGIFLVGGFTATIDFGGGAMASVTGSTDIFIASLTEDGQYLWAKSFGGAGSDIGTHITRDSQENVTMMGYFLGTVDFGGGPLRSTSLNHFFIASFDNSGQHLWSDNYNASVTSYGEGIRSSGNRDLVAVGRFQGAIDLGGGLLTSAGADDLFLLKLSR